jgi:hypothetical protein
MVVLKTVLRIWDVYPGSEFFHSGSRIQGQKDADPSTPKNFSIFNPENCLSFWKK